MRIGARVRAMVMDCSAGLLAAGVCVADKVVADCAEVGIHHGEQLMPRLRALCRILGVERASDVGWDLIVCGQGPGSFSGVRVALSTAKGLALALGAPFVLVPTLTAWARTVSSAGTVLPVVDARRDSVYTQIFVDDQPISPVWDIGAVELRVRLRDFPRPWCAVGPDARLLFGEDFRIYPPDGSAFVEQLLRLGRQRWQRQGGEKELAGPHYLRAAVPRQGEFVTLKSPSHAFFPPES